MADKTQGDDYTAAWNDFLVALGIDPEGVFEVVSSPEKTVVKKVKYTTNDSGVHKGDFWIEEVEAEKGGKDK